MKILIACEFSGIVRDAFIAKGHDAVSCDILPTERPGPHIQDDVLNHLDENWDMMIAHPPCTYLSNSGVRWLHTKYGRWNEMMEGAVFFRTLLNADIEKICVENPIQHCYARDIIGVKYSQIIQPYQFGHMERKATCLWLKNLPLLQSTFNVYNEMIKLPKGIQNRIHYISGPDRSKLRSVTFNGIANAMTDQWG